MDLSSIYISNCTGILILLMLCYASRTRIFRRNIEDMIYTFMILGVMLGCFMEMLSYTLDGKVFIGSRLTNYIANTYLFSVNLLLPFCVIVYVDLGLYNDISRIRKNYKVQIIVGVILLAANIVNFFYPIVYYITDQNVYQRRPLSYVYYVVILYYCISGIIVTRKYEKENGASAFFNIGVFLFPILLGAGLQFLFYGLSLAWLASAIGLTCLFMMQQNELAYIDSLVDTYNRQYMNIILSAWIARGKSFCGIMIDLDRFKNINDQYGHSEGDRALKTLTDILKASRIDHEWVFRFAGDEFIILKKTNDENGLIPYMEKVARMLEEHNQNSHSYPLVLSYGMSFYTNGDLDSFMKEMDTRLYAMKAEHHRLPA